MPRKKDHMPRKKDHIEIKGKKYPRFGRPKKWVATDNQVFMLPTLLDEASGSLFVYPPEGYVFALEEGPRGLYTILTPKVEAA